MVLLVAVAPLDSHLTRLSDEVENQLETGPFDLGERVTLRRVPRWLEKSGSLELLNPRQRHWVSSSSHCLWTSLRERADPKDKLETVQILVDVNIALWLAKPSGLGFEIVAFSQQRGPKWESRAGYTVDQLRPHPRDFGIQLTLDDLYLARRLHRSIRKQPLGTSVDIARRFLMRALHEVDWSIRYLMLWVGLEALFGTSQEVAHRLSLRLAFFLEGRTGDRKQRYDTARDCYKWRSRLVHGVPLRKLKGDESAHLLLESERMLRSSMNRILLEPDLQTTFAGKGREDYLENLLFKS